MAKIVQVPVRLSKAYTETVTVDYETVPGTATSPDDFSTASGTLTFNPGETVKYVSVTVQEPTAQEPTEMFSVLLSAPVKATLADDTGQVTIPAGGAGATFEYLDRFNWMYSALHDSSNGYFGPPSPTTKRKMPYHCPELLINEAPDWGHESVSETASFWVGLEAWNGALNNDWTGYQSCWTTIESQYIPSATLQPIGTYDASDPADYADEKDTPDLYPVLQDSSAAVGADPLFAELQTTYSTKTLYLMHWMIDVDGIYGYANGDGSTECVFINNFRRGLQESSWETVTHPCWENFSYGSNYGFLPIYSQNLPLYPAAEFEYNTQWFYTCAPDAEARAVQWGVWADKFAAEQGVSATISAQTAKVKKMGDYLRYALFDKYFRKIGDDRAQGGSNYESCHYLINWYVSWGGQIPQGGQEGVWSFRIGCSECHQGYQAVDAAYFMATGGGGYAPLSTSAGDIWLGSLYRQIEMIRWLQSPEGPIAGGVTNSLFARYETPTDGRQNATFYGMHYVYSPVWHDPPSNNWVGFQAWGQGRTADAFLEVSDKSSALAVAIRPNLEIILDRLVVWFLENSTIEANSFSLPSTLSWVSESAVPGETTSAPNLEGVYEYLPDLDWDGTGDYAAFWLASTVPNENLHCTIAESGTDLGVAASLAYLLIAYAEAKRRMSKFDTEILGSGYDARDAYQLAKDLIDRIWDNYRDSIGIAIEEERADYDRFEGTLYIPSTFSGTMPNGDVINSSSNFASIRSFIKDQAGWTEIKAYVDAPETAPVPTFTYHRFWAQAEYAMACGALHKYFDDLLYA